MNTSSSTPPTPDENAGDAALDMLLNSAPESSETASADADKVAEATENSAPIVATKSAEAPTLQEPPVISKLREATRDLLMQSETDEPFRTVYWPLETAEITPSEVALYLTENADATVETQSVKAFFENAVTTEDWMDDEEQATAKRFGELVETINDELEKPCVYLIGERERTAAILGKIEGGFAGVVTSVVET